MPPPLQEKFYINPDIYMGIIHVRSSLILRPHPLQGEGSGTEEVGPGTPFFVVQFLVILIHIYECRIVVLGGGPSV